jgi:hypothetical protein
MKLLSILFLSLIVGKACNGEKKQNIDYAVIEYVANTRGFYQKIVIDKKTVSISSERKSNKPAIVKKISDADWKILNDSFEDIDLEELKDLKSPTEKRFYDGAAIANLKISYNDEVYESSSFDHGFPPYEIKKLVNKINSFAKQNNEN